MHLSKPRLPAVVIGLLYKLLWGAAVLVDIDDEELLFVGEREPITLDGLKRLCTQSGERGIFGVTPLAASSVCFLPSETGPAMPGGNGALRSLTNCSPAVA